MKYTLSLTALLFATPVLAGSDSEEGVAAAGPCKTTRSQETQTQGENPLNEIATIIATPNSYKDKVEEIQSLLTQLQIASQPRYTEDDLRNFARALEKALSYESRDLVDKAKKSVDLIKALVQKGVPIDKKMEMARGNNITALRYVVCNWDSFCNTEKIVKELLELGADPKQKDEEGTPILEIAAGKGNLNIIGQLLDAGADINGQSERGWTALMEAVRKGDLETIKFLLKKGAKVDLRNTFGEKACDIEPRFCDKERVQEIKRLLTEAEAQKKPAQ